MRSVFQSVSQRRRFSDVSINILAVFSGVACLAAGRYNDEFVKENGRFKSVYVTPFFVVPQNESLADKRRGQ
jgi:hypothetical protein